MKVVGVGLGRTGTMSLKHALNKLGYKTFHTDEMFFHYKIFGMFLKDVFAYPPKDQQYPDAKFILTTRSTPEMWAKSWIVLIRDSVSLMPRFVSWFPGVWKIDRYNRWLDAYLHQDVAFIDHPYPLPHSVDKLAQAYTRHVDAVRREFSNNSTTNDNFLDYQVSQGWEPLCAFLNKPVPANQPFPHLNKGTSVVWRLRFTVLAFNGALVLLVVFALRFVRRLFMARDSGAPKRD